MKRIYTIMAMGLLVLLTACQGETTIGTPAPAGTAVVPLAEIMSRPADFDGKTVVLHGNLVAQCAALCDFTYNEGNRSVTIHTETIKPPRLNPGQPLRVTARVHSGSHQVVLTAEGLELLPRKGGG